MTAASGIAAPAVPDRGGRRDRAALLPYLLLAPSLLFLALFFAAPMVQAFLLAFQDQGQWSLANFRTVAGDLNFADALWDTLALAVVTVPLQVALALAMALLLEKLPRGRDLVLYVWTIPLGISDLAAGLVWLAMLEETGYLNSALRAVGLIHQPEAWLTYEHPVALFAGVVVAELWRATALVLVILVAGLQLIPKGFGEAAGIFGATPWQRFRHVTLPLLRPSLRTALILRTILAFEVFAVVYALAGRTLPVLVGEAFAWQNDYQNLGVAAAYGALILVISLGSTALYLRLVKGRDEAAP